MHKIVEKLDLLQLKPGAVVTVEGSISKMNMQMGSTTLYVVATNSIVLSENLYSSDSGEETPDVVQKLAIFGDWQGCKDPDDVKATRYMEVGKAWKFDNLYSFVTTKLTITRITVRD